MPVRPGYGTLGSPVELRTNFFPIEIPESRVIYDYEVSIEPKDKAGAERRKRIFQLLESHQDYLPYVGHIAHDSSQRLVSAEELPKNLSVQIQYYEEAEGAPRAEGLQFTVVLKLKGRLNTHMITKGLGGDLADADANPEPLISALNLVLQHHASRAGVRVGRSTYFLGSSKSSPLGPGLETRPGFFISARPRIEQFMVNINTCITAFHLPGNLAARMMELRRSRGSIPSSYLEGLKVITQHHGYPHKYRIFRVTDTNAAQTQFHCAELGCDITVEKFFERKYNIKLTHVTDLPLVDVGHTGKPVYMPVELCEIAPNQPFRGHLGSKETSRMIKLASRSPAQNVDTIVREGLPSLGLQPGTPGSPLGAFDIQVSQQMAIVPGRILPPPQVAYRGKNIDVLNGSWNLRDVKFQAPSDVSSWMVLLVQTGERIQFKGTDDPELDHFLARFAKTCRDCGMNIDAVPERIVTPRLPPSPNDALGMIRDTLRTNVDITQKPSFILVLLPDDDSFIYSGIKRFCDATLGVHTMCMLLYNARIEQRKQVQYFANVALKLNTKLGGINHLLNAKPTAWLTKAKTMLVGIDVTHPGPSSPSGMPSIAAVVANVDDTFVQFPTSLMLQKPDGNKKAKEVIPSPNLTSMMEERLWLYRARNGCLPERIVVYRDGVSEGQYAAVLEHELPQISKAFERFSGETLYKPTLTIAVCGKQHHVRLYPTDKVNMTKNGNTRPGTVVDRRVTYVDYNDFYLQAHAGLQGTVKPTHYVVIYDENRYSADVLQQGTHTTSYLYVRATKAVSLVPPAYYADLACERARCYLHGLFSPRDKSFKGKGRAPAEREADKDRVYEEAVEMWGNGVHEDLKETMFYI
ncbi:Piwi-domain-containing protein [Obba rivulosa]|uniref:Piwi-domain-containing protein n=1 Tax=Obba rivulosa TaxID=1052685 RepID=A0A8E2B3H2_9APHY|nr:Piwi-domain-containing protein [Obba rivulosa]